MWIVSVCLLLESVADYHRQKMSRLFLASCVRSIKLIKPWLTHKHAEATMTKNLNEAAESVLMCEEYL